MKKVFGILSANTFDKFILISSLDFYQCFTKIQQKTFRITSHSALFSARKVVSVRYYIILNCCSSNIPIIKALILVTWEQIEVRFLCAFCLRVTLKCNRITPEPRPFTRSNRFTPPGTFGVRASNGPPGHLPIGSGRLGVPVAHLAQANSDPFPGHIPARLRPLGYRQNTRLGPTRILASSHVT